MIGALRGLHAAHEARNDTGEPLHIVHRDISPHNLLVGVDGTTRVLDFGVATASQRIQTTQHGEIKGKLSYMAPEQLLSRPVDRRADIYAASVVMWEALSGARLFKAENDGAALKQILTDEPRLPSQLNPAIPLALEAAVMRGLERDADRRFSTAEEMALAIEAAVRVASNTDVGHLVATWCRPSLAERERIIAAIEAHQSAPSRRVAVETLESLAPKEPRPPSSPDLLLREPALAAEPGDEVTRSLATPLAPQLPEPGSEPTRGVEHGRKRPALGAAAALVLVTRIPCTGPRSRRARWRDADSRV
jgi:serine/threonine-protein kinase